MDLEYLKTNIEKLLKYTQELEAWCGARSTIVNPDMHRWFKGFESDFFRKLNEEREAAKRLIAKQAALAKLTDEEKSALGLA